MAAEVVITPHAVHRVQARHTTHGLVLQPKRLRREASHRIVSIFQRSSLSLLGTWGWWVTQSHEAHLGVACCVRARRARGEACVSWKKRATSGSQHALLFVTSALQVLTSQPATVAGGYGLLVPAAHVDRSLSSTLVPLCSMAVWGQTDY